MKKVVVCLLMLLSIFVVSCSTPAEKSIKEFEKIVVEAESGSVDTEKEFELLVQKLDTWEEKYKNVEYTARQQKEIEELGMRLVTAFSEHFVGLMGGAFSGLMNGVSGLMKGFVGGMRGFVDGMHELVDEMQDLADEMQDLVGEIQWDVRLVSDSVDNM